jgi:hypothetical protein
MSLGHLRAGKSWKGKWAVKARTLVHYSTISKAETIAWYLALIHTTLFRHPS